MSLQNINSFNNSQLDWEMHGLAIQMAWAELTSAMMAPEPILLDESVLVEGQINALVLTSDVDEISRIVAELRSLAERTTSTQLLDNIFLALESKLHLCEEITNQPFPTLFALMAKMSEYQLFRFLTSVRLQMSGDLPVKAFKKVLKNPVSAILHVVEDFISHFCNLPNLGALIDILSSVTNSDLIDRIVKTLFQNNIDHVQYILKAVLSFTSSSGRQKILIASVLRNITSANAIILDTIATAIIDANLRNHIIKHAHLLKNTNHLRNISSLSDQEWVLLAESLEIFPAVNAERLTRMLPLFQDNSLRFHIVSHLLLISSDKKIELSISALLTLSMYAPQQEMSSLWRVKCIHADDMNVRVWALQTWWAMTTLSDSDRALFVASLRELEARDESPIQEEVSVHLQAKIDELILEVSEIINSSKIPVPPPQRETPSLQS